MKSIPCFLAFIAVSLFATTAFGGPAIGGIPGTPGTPPPGTQPPGTVGGVVDPSLPGGAYNTQYKTPPMTAGQPWNVQIEVHNPGPNAIPNWAGVLAQVHIADASEVDVTKISLLDANGTVIVDPFGPASQNSQSVLKTFQVLHPAWQQSGTNLQSSNVYPVMDIELQAKNTTMTNGNSDFDVTVDLYDIYHVPGGQVIIPGSGQASTFVTVFNPGSQQWTWPQSGLAFVRSSIQSSQDLHVGPDLTQGGQPIPLPPEGTEIEPSMYYLRGPANQDTGHWHHIEQSIVWHALASVTTIHRSVTGPGGTVVTMPGSFLYAVKSTSAMIGIEHVPEPAAPILLASGLVCTVLGFRSRRRRQGK